MISFGQGELDRFMSVAGLYTLVFEFGDVGSEMKRGEEAGVHVTVVFGQQVDVGQHKTIEVPRLVRFEKSYVHQRGPAESLWLVLKVKETPTPHL